MAEIVKYYKETVNKTDSKENLEVEIKITQEEYRVYCYKPEPYKYTITINGEGELSKALVVVQQLLEEIVGDYGKEKL